MTWKSPMEAEDLGTPKTGRVIWDFHTLFTQSVIARYGKVVMDASRGTEWAM